jgi:hypothetical protein
MMKRLHPGDRSCYHLGLAALCMWLLLPASGAMATDGNDLPLLFGIEVGSGSAKVLVISNGCTEATDFMLEVRSTGEEAELVVRRLRDDPCRMAPHIVELALDLPSDAGGTESRYRLVNRLAPSGPLHRRR